ncbi:hypothetical protein K2X85_09850 [bacterium]|jgi:hypothetical protein|nr:hypothetical protein [bacterium]
MRCSFAIVATGESRYLKEALASIDWHLARKPGLEFVLFVDQAAEEFTTRARVERLEPLTTSLPAMVVGWYRKTQVLRQILESNPHPVCLLDTYSRILRFDLFAEGLTLAEKFHFCLAADPRRTLARELELGRGIGPQVARDLSTLPTTFPLWNTGVVLASPHPVSRTLVQAWEESSRHYLDQGEFFREQLTLIQAVDRTGITPLTLPDSFNVRRPWVDPAVVLHTRRFGHAYGVAEVDRPEQRFEQARHRIKMSLGHYLGLDRWFYP